MSHTKRNLSPLADIVPPKDDEESVIRSRDTDASGGRSRERSSPELDAVAATQRRHSSTRPVAGSLDDRLEKKMLAAGELIRDLPPTDSRVRLLYVAIMRRDEALLDGVLAELNKLHKSG